MSLQLPLPSFGSVMLMLKTILREGGHIEMGFRRVVPRPGSGLAEPVGNFREVGKHMAERGELVQYRKKTGDPIYYWGMRGITPDVCKDRDELAAQMEIMAHRLDRASKPRWLSFLRRQPTDKQRIVAFVPVLANAGHVGQVVGRFDASSGLVTVHLIIPIERRAHHTTVQYEFSHWMSQQADPDD
jgi:hypothetical protein